MKFFENHIDDFIRFSSEIKPIISGQAGCLNLDILQDMNEKDIFFTYSHWESLDDLNKYRQSDFFKDVWPKAKEWFSGKPEVWSLVQTETIKL